MVEQPSLNADILERFPALRQAGLDTTSRLVGLAMTLWLRWSTLDPDRLDRHALATQLKAHYALLAQCQGEILTLAAQLSDCFTPRLEDFLDAHLEEWDV